VQQEVTSGCQPIDIKKEKSVMAPLLDNDVKTQVKEVFKDLVHPVEILFFGQDGKNCEYCQDTLSLLQEVSDLSDKISLQEFDLERDTELAKKYRVDKAPGFALLGRLGDDLTDFGIRYAGIPAGHEFTSLINDLILVSRRDSGLNKDTRDALAKIDQPVLMQVFVTPTCPYCPRAVVLAHQMAMENPLIEAEMVESMEFNELANRFNVSGVPHTVINSGKSEVVGAVPEPQLLQKIQQAVLA
jgi:glutaredoxin-like protein